MKPMTREQLIVECQILVEGFERDVRDAKNSGFYSDKSRHKEAMALVLRANIETLKALTTAPIAISFSPTTDAAPIMIWRSDYTEGV